MDNQERPSPEQKGVSIQPSELDPIPSVSSEQVIMIAHKYYQSMIQTEQLAKKVEEGLSLTEEEQQLLTESMTISITLSDILEILGQEKLIRTLYNKVMNSLPQDDQL